MHAWWGMLRRKGPPGRSGPPPAERRGWRRQPGATMKQCCLVSFVRPYAGQYTGRGGGCLLPDDQCTRTGRPVAEVLREKHPGIRVPPVEIPTCAAFKEYGEVHKTVPLDFTEDDVTWVASKLPGVAGALGAEVIELQNWLLQFWCSSE